MHPKYAGGATQGIRITKSVNEMSTVDTKKMFVKSVDLFQNIKFSWTLTTLTATKRIMIQLTYKPYALIAID